LGLGREDSRGWDGLVSWFCGAGEGGGGGGELGERTESMRAVSEGLAEGPEVLVVLVPVVLWLVWFEVVISTPSGGEEVGVSIAKSEESVVSFSSFWSSRSVSGWESDFAPAPPFSPRVM
jgi:hypothetical protein